MTGAAEWFSSKPLQHIATASFNQALEFQHPDQ